MATTKTPNGKTEHAVKMFVDRTTPGTYLYRCDPRENTTTAMKSMYVQKDKVPSPPPVEIEVILRY